MLQIEDYIMITTNHRTIMIEVDSSMFVSSFEPWLEGVVAVYPNPVSDELILQVGAIGGKALVRIFDALGRQVYEKEIPPSPAIETLAIPVARWQAGVYVVRIEAQERHIVKRVVVVER